MTLLHVSESVNPMNKDEKISKYFWKSPRALKEVELPMDYGGIPF